MRPSPVPCALTWTWPLWRASRRPTAGMSGVGVGFVSGSSAEATEAHPTAKSTALNVASATGTRNPTCMGVPFQERYNRGGDALQHKRNAGCHKRNEINTFQLVVTSTIREHRGTYVPRLLLLSHEAVG